MDLASFVLKCLLAATCVSSLSESKRVLSIPAPFPSHVKYHTNVARAMAERGHQVWITMPTVVLEKSSLDTSGFSTVLYDIQPGIVEITEELLNGVCFEGKFTNFYELMMISKNVVDTLLRNDSFLRTIAHQKPDLIVVDNIPNYYALSIIPYKLGIPFAFMGSSYYLSILRVPFSPAEVPFNLFFYTNQMTFMQRLLNTLLYVLFAVYNPAFLVDAVSVYAPEMDYLPLDELVRKAEIFLVELDHVLDYPKPTLPNIKLIGGTTTGPARPLPAEYQSFMNSAKDGVVIVSFGSYTLGVPKHISDKILQVLMQLPMKSVFRSNLTSPDPEKIMTSAWIPQNDLLGHPNTKVFVSHCGKNSQYEALYHAVPIVAAPLFADQFYNAERSRMKGFAEVLDINACTSDQMKSAIVAVANEPKYKEVVVKLSRLFKELYGVPMERAAFWLEHVMEHGGDYMRSAGQQMPWYQFVLLDVLLFIFCVLVLTVGFLCGLLKIVCRCFCKQKMKKE